MKRFGWFFLLSWLLMACTPGVGYQAGLYTQKVVGRLAMQPTPFIVVITQEETFLGEPNRPIYQTRARIVKPNRSGEYEVTFSDAAREVRLIFVAPGRQTLEQDFGRTLGIGAYEYSPELLESPEWEQEFSLQLKPYLMGFLLENRYEMPAGDKFFLGNWIREMEQKVEQDETQRN